MSLSNDLDQFLAVDIVSGAYPMPIRPSVRPSVCQPLFKSNRLPQFSSGIFGLNVHNNIAPKVVE